MKKQICILLSLLFLLVLPLSAAASQPYVVDKAGLLAPEDAAELENGCRQFFSEYGMEIAIVTVSSLDGKSATDYADDYFYANYGEDGILLVISPSERDWAIFTCGTAIPAYTDADLMDIEDSILYSLKDDDYADAFRRFLSGAEEYRGIDEGLSGDTARIIALPGGAVIAAIVVFIMRSSMSTRRPQHGAVSYEVEGSYNLRRHQDLFLYSKITKTEKPEKTNQSTTHTSSSGRTHGGRSGKY